MTREEFKWFVEEVGVEDDMVIEWIDVGWPEADFLRVEFSEGHHFHIES